MIGVFYIKSYIGEKLKAGSVISMKKEENRKLIKKIESLINPKDSATISFFSEFTKNLPKKTQDKYQEKGSKKIPYMGFIVDPYCFFLAYKITNTSAAQDMLPEGYELAETSLYKGGDKYPMAIAAVFTARTSAFSGMRLEFYIIARNRETGLLSWIISDYETNTNSHDPKAGFGGFSTSTAVYTISPYGELLVDIKNRENDNEFILTADIKNGETRELDESLWIEGNLSVDYGGNLKTDAPSHFTLIFDPVLMKEAVNIPIKNIQIESNSYLNNIIDPIKPVDAVLFPYTQHFVIKQDLKKYEIQKESDLYPHIKTFLDRTGFKTMSGDDIKKPIFRSMKLSFLITTGIIITLLILLLIK